MASIQEARQILQQQQEQVRQAEERLRQERARASQVSQQQLRQQRGGIAGLQQRRVEQQKKETQISSYERELQSKRQELKSYEAQIKESELQQQQAEAQRKAYQEAFAVFLGGKLTEGAKEVLRDPKMYQQLQKEAQKFEGRRTKEYSPEELSKLGLSGAEIEAVAKGLTYIPSASIKELQAQQIGGITSQTQTITSPMDLIPSGSITDILAKGGSTEYKIPTTSTTKISTQEFYKGDFVSPETEIKTILVPELRTEEIEKFDVNILQTPKNLSSSIQEAPKGSSLIEIDPRTGKPYGKIEKAPTTKERFIEYVKERGPITGPIKFLGGEMEEVGIQAGLGGAGKYKNIPIVGSQEPYRPYVIGTILKTTTEISPFFTPAGPYVLTAEGAESFLFPGGREEIKKLGSGLEEQYGIPKETAWLLPAGEIFLGTSSLWFPKIKGFIRTKGREEVLFPGFKSEFPTAGEGLSPTQRAELHKRIFLKGEFVPPGFGVGGYHATPEPWTSLEATKPTHIAPQVSYHFLGVPGPGTSEIKTTGDWISRLAERITYSPEIGTKPGVMFIEPAEGKKGFQINIGTEVKRGEYVWTKPTKKGVAYIPGTKAEIQSVFIPETQLIPTGGEFFFKYKGVRYPIDTFKATLGTETTTGFKTYGELLPTYSGVSKSQVPATYNFLYPLSSETYSDLSVSKTSAIPKTEISYPTTSTTTSKFITFISKPKLPSISSPFPKSDLFIPSIPSYKIPKMISPGYSISKTSYFPSKKQYPSYSYPTIPKISQKERRRGLIISKPKTSKLEKRKTKTPFGIETKQKGKYYESPLRFRELREALKLGKGITKKTLGASFKLFKIEKGIKKYISPLQLKNRALLGKEFRPSIAKKRRDPFAIIQKKRKVGGIGSRLGTRSEIKAIQLARRNKKLKFFK